MTVTDSTQGLLSPHRPGVDLKWSLMWRVAVVALLCLLAGAAVAIYRANIEAVEANRSVGESVGRHLDLQLLRIESALDVRERFPDAEALLMHVLNPGQCVQYVDASGKTILSNCVGFKSLGKEAPSWFSALFGLTLASRLAYERPLVHKGGVHGKIVVSSDPSAMTLLAWSDISRMLGLFAPTIAALCFLVYFVIERALRPTKDVITGLNRLAGGDLTTRLPSFQLVELQRISEVFNGLAATLETTISERAGLARRLVDAQEQERRHLARELHDELAQSLSAMSATAASIKATAATDCPALVPEAKTLAETASNIMKVLRRTLRELRPQEIDELGLLASIQGLVAEHNSRAHGKTRFRLDVDGDARALPPAMSVHIYRIVQEGLTNAAKHAQAANVRVMLRIWPARNEAPSGDARTIDIEIEDDGTGQTTTKNGEKGFGLGLIGIRERVLALGGQMTAGPRPDKGLILKVTIPAPDASEWAT
ncbi:MAG: histidine kinase [Hyphomicrobium sp.]